MASVPTHADASAGSLDRPGADAPAGGAVTALRPERVEPRDLGDLVRLLPGARVATADHVLPAVTGVTQDSRAVRPGDLYLARPGEHAHGADFTGAAVAAGAVAVLTDAAGEPAAVAAGVPVVVVPDPRAVTGAVAAWVYGDPARDLVLIGITGTNGKTTSSYLVEAALRAAGHTTGLIGTIETRAAGEVVPSVRTTPEATDLQALFAVMRERGVTAAAMEVSSHALALQRVAGTTYTVALFTNLSQDHLDFHRDVEDYFAAKSLLFTPAYSRQAVVYVDDPYGARLAASTPIDVTTFSLGATPDADWLVRHIEAGPAGSRAEVRGPDGEVVTIDVPLPGRFNVANAVGALVAVHLTGVDLDVAARGIAALTGVPGRMERVDAGQEFAALVDYAHTPEAVATLLDTLRPVTAGRLIGVLGCGGDRDRGKRPLMGAALAERCDLAILTSDNPRSEDPAEILAAMAAGARGVDESARGEVVVEIDRHRAIDLAVAAAGPGDTVVVAGKGHEQGQDVGGVVSPFDDRLVLAEAIRRTKARA